MKNIYFLFLEKET